MVLSIPLRFDVERRAYTRLHVQATPESALAVGRRRAPERVRPAMQVLLDRLTEIPAFVLGRRLDILA